MRASALAVALCACGSVAKDPSPAQDAAPPPGDTAIDASPPRTMVAHLAKTPPVTFGGGPKGFCTYTITLQDLDVMLEVQRSGDVTAGRVQDTNVEAIVGTCNAGTIPAKLATYTLDTAKPVAGGTMLTFQAGAANEPQVTLTGTLATGGSTVRLAFQRGGTADPVLDWLVTATLTLTAQ
jgi:hypothetical protein